MADKKPLILTNGYLQQMQTGDTVPVANGGTGAIDATNARTNLGLVIGTNVQQYDADLAAIAAFSSTGIAVRTASDTWAQRQIAVASTARLTITNPAGVAGDFTLDLATLADGGTGSFLKITRDTYGRVSGTTAVVAGDISGLVDTRYVRLDNSTTLNNGIVISYNSATTITGAYDLVTKNYVDSLSAGLDVKGSVRLATTAALSTLGTTPTYNSTGGTSARGQITWVTGPTAIDSVNLVNGDRILVKDEGSGTHASNGVWVRTSQNTWDRAADFDADAEATAGSFFFVEEGTTYADSGWVLTTNNPITLGGASGTAITFAQFSGAGQISAGNGLTKTGNTIDVVTAASTRILVNADSIDLGQPTIGGSGSGSGFTKVSVDVYGRISNTGAATAADVGAQAADATLTALAGLTATTGLLVQTAADTFTTRNIVSAGGRLTITNPAGVAGNIDVDLTSGVIASPGTYTSVTVDTYGRVTAGSNPGGTGANNTSTLTNGEATQVVIGSVVYNDAGGSFKKAVANADATSKAIGVAIASINSAQSGSIATAGEVTATTGEWDTVTGQTGGLTFGSMYYIDNTTAGKMTSTPPSTGYVCPVGYAISTTKLIVRIGPRVQL